MISVGLGGMGHGKIPQAAGWTTIRPAEDVTVRVSEGIYSSSSLL